MDVLSKFAPNLYSAARAVLSNDAPIEKPAVDSGAGSGPSFGETLAAAARQTIVGLQQSEKTAAAGMVGKADPHSVVEALAATELALETAVTVRDRVVEAYQEILRMPV